MEDIDKRMAEYKRMLAKSQDIHDYFSSGKKIIKGHTLRMQKEVDKREGQEKPPWRSTGTS